MRVALALVFAAPILLPAQDIVVTNAGDRQSAAIIRDAAAKPHAVRGGSGRLDLPRDSTITTTLIVLGRPTYLASRVHGDVVVIGSDLFLRPGAEVSGQAVAIGGTVALTTLGHVAGGTESFRDDVYMVVPLPSGRGYSMAIHDQRLPDEIPRLQPAGLQGLLMPTYDRVNGLSLPVAALVTVGARVIELEPTVTYRSQLGKFDPSAVVRVWPDRAVHFEARAGIDTRSNDSWIYSNLVNSASSFFTGTDARNYFRSTGGEGRLFGLIERPGHSFAPFIGARYETTSPISTGSVFSVRGRRDIEHMARPNPLVENGSIGSALVGVLLADTSGPVMSRLRVEVERSLSTIAGTASFTQGTLDGRIQFPTFGTQGLSIRGHGVGTAGGENVTRARYAYLGHSGTLPLVEMFELGGTELIFIESHYSIPLDRVILPMVGSPVIILRHLVGTAGVSRLPALEQEVGVGLGVNLVRLDFTVDAARRRGSKVGIGLSLSK